MGNIYFVDRKIRLDECPRCHVRQFVGVAEGLPFKVDPIPVTIKGELVARLQERWTYGVNFGIRKLFYRDDIRMRHIPRGAVLADHKCGKELYDHVEIPYIRPINDLVERLKPREPEPEILENSIMTIAHVLGGKMIDDNDCPF